MTIATDLSGGLDPAREQVLTGPPDNPLLRESVNMWIWDDEARFGLPRICLEAHGDRWDRPFLMCNIARPGGEVLLGHADARKHPELDAAGNPTVFGAGPLTFRCVTPFDRWTASFAGPAVRTSAARQLAVQPPDTDPVDVAFEVECTMAVPPWVYGQLDAKADAALRGGKDGRFVVGDHAAGFRHEQLFRAVGTFTVDGETIEFRGGGLRIHRVGIRQVVGNDYPGHAWLSAVFPSGRAFGASSFPERGGGASFNEAFLYDGHRRVAARAVAAPYPEGGGRFGTDASIVLESELGRTGIRGEVVLPTHLPPGFGPPACAPGEPPIWFEQSIARYEWDGEIAYGMLERS
jgi:hypothetical protein